ncbi:MAG: methylated-DNA--[protein]-cysteine S-methyltransferase [Raoultibacter sp.]
MATETRTYFTYNTPVGHITIGSNGAALTHIVFGIRVLPGEKKATKLTNDAANQIQEYLAGKRFAFDLPLAAAGTNFQKQVWMELQTIPYGQTRSYSDIAVAIGKPNACRAVGGANNKNPLAIVIPCHRVIGANGKPVGYAGGLKTKEFLLALEQNQKNRDAS